MVAYLDSGPCAFGPRHMPCIKITRWSQTRQCIEQTRVSTWCGWVVVDGVYTVLLNVYLPHTLSLYWKTKTITETITIIQTYTTVE